MKVQRILLFLAALLAFVASAPAATAQTHHAASAALGTSAAASTDRQSREDASTRFTDFPAVHRVSMAASGTGRRAGDAGARHFVLATADPRVGTPDVVARVDGEAGARLLRSANTPCCVRGPPTAD